MTIPTCTGCGVSIPFPGLAGVPVVVMELELVMDVEVTFPAVVEVEVVVGLFGLGIEAGPEASTQYDFPVR